MRRVRPRSVVARLAAALAREELHSRALPSAVDARIQLWPYQLEPALALLGPARRVLLADAVGLGKTIQAGLVIAELRRRRPSLRALVAVPSALRRQWRDELRTHFGIDTILADAGGLEAVARSSHPHSTPWERSGVWIGSIDYLKQPHVVREAARRAWDVLVIDEAHGVCGESERHDAAATLARCSRRVLLLTATPHSGSEPHFQRLFALGSLPGHADDMAVFRRTRADLGMRADRCVRRRSVELSVEEAQVLGALDRFEQAVLARGAHGAGPLLLSVFRKRALSTMGAFKRSVERRLTFLDTRDGASRDLWSQGRLFFDDPEDDVSSDERLALSADTGLPDAVERSWLRRIHGLACDASRRESKVRRMLTFARRCREPIAIFTEFRDSLHLLRPHVEAIRCVAVLHGGLSPDEQQRQLDRFLSGQASVLLATDVASQGLNLQARCRCVLNLELPWNPSRLEQRAGRVDRIGQHRRVHIELFVARHAAEAGLLGRLDARTLAARLTGPMCTRWARPARVLARRLGRQRALALKWRGPFAAHRPWAACVDSRRHLSRLAGTHTLLVFSAPIGDGTGDAIERWLMCVRVATGALSWPDEPSGRSPREVIDAARALVAQRLAPRVRRLQRLKRAECADASDVERAMTQAMLSERPEVEVQPGLFDRRALSAESAATADTSEIRHALQRRLDALDAGATVAAGVPGLIAVLFPFR